MSDAILERIAKSLETIAAGAAKVAAGAASGGGATRPAATGGAATSANKAAPDAAAAAAAKTAAAAAAAAAKTAAAAKAAAAKPGAGGPPAGTKAPGGKHTVDQVRELIRKVATNASLGKQSASDILDQDGGGVTSVKDLKPENYDKVFEACQVLLSGEGDATPAASPEDDLM